MLLKNKICFALVVPFLCQVSAKAHSQGEEEQVLLLGLGTDVIDEFRNNFDLVRVNYTDENSFGIYCNPLQDFFWSGHQATGNFVHGKIVTCGGYASGYGTQAGCFFYTEIGWVEFGFLNEPKAGHASMILPNGDLWVTGGYTSDYIGSDFIVRRGPNTPRYADHHCSTGWNETHVVIIGGFQDYPYQEEENGNRMDFFNIETEEWSRGPGLLRERNEFHDCVTFTDIDGETKIMVVGGGGIFDSTTHVEIFDGFAWTKLDDIQTFLREAKAVLVDDKIILTGGNNANAWEFDIATRTWSTSFGMKDKMRYHEAFLVPKNSYCTDVPRGSD